MSVSGGLNPLTSLNYDYDAAGNLIDDGTYSYTFDALNQLAAIKRNSDNKWLVSFQVDALGRQIIKYDHLHYDATNNFTPIEYYYYDGGRRIEARRLVLSGQDVPGENTIDDCSPPGLEESNAAEQILMSVTVPSPEIRTVTLLLRVTVITWSMFTQLRASRDQDRSGLLLAQMEPRFILLIITKLLYR